VADKWVFIFMAIRSKVSFCGEAHVLAGFGVWMRNI
jgi:hypothetical protein